jgi:hypothetical protein
MAGERGNAIRRRHRRARDRALYSIGITPQVGGKSIAIEEPSVGRLIGERSVGGQRFVSPRTQSCWVGRIRSSLTLTCWGWVTT